MLSLIIDLIKVISQYNFYANMLTYSVKGDFIMENSEILDRIKENAYFNYLNRVNKNISGDALQDWDAALIDAKIEDRIKEEAYLHFLNYGDYPVLNWLVAEREIKERLSFLAFYLHEANLNKTPIENWKDAQRLYIEKY